MKTTQKKHGKSRKSSSKAPLGGTFESSPWILGGLAIFLALFGAFQLTDAALGGGLEASSLSPLVSSTSQEQTPEEKSQKLALAEERQKDPTPFPKITDPPALEAKTAMVIEAESGEALFKKNANAQLPLASITKVMTALVAEEALDEDTRITITPQSARTEGVGFVPAGSTWRFEELLNYGLVRSSNKAMEAIARKYHESPETQGTLVEAMNTRAEGLGLDQTYFLNPSGLDTDNTVSGGYGSAADVAKLLSHILEAHPELLTSTTQPSITVTTASGRSIRGENTNTLLNEIPGALASKTGYTELAGGNLAVAWDAGISQPIIAVVLGSTREARFRDIQKLIEATVSASTQEL